VKKLPIAVVLFLMLVLSACVQQTTYPPYPIIKFSSLSKNTIHLLPAQGYTQDSVALTISFTDGEGGIGPNGIVDTSTSIIPCSVHSYDSSVINNPAYNVFWYEYHASNVSTDSCLDRLATAYIADNPKFSSISGLIQFFPTIECPPTGNVDTITFSVFIKDRNGKVSNRVRTPPIVVTCQ
jgi:hypothetical protein